jgi:hypothetical protein
MDIEIAREIKELLMADGLATIPNLGTFVSSYKPAVVDGITGTIQPPSFQINFDINRQINDGKLVEALRERQRISASAAQEMIETYVQEVKAHFAKNEIVVLPEVGRLFLDFAGTVQFLPENMNFNADVYGLPTVSFTPISRHRPEPAVTEQVTDTEPSLPPVLTLTKTEPITKPLVDPLELPKPMGDIPPPIIIEKKNRPAWLPHDWQSWIPAMAVAVLTALAVIIWLNAPDTEGSKKTKERVNTSPLETNKEQNAANGAPNQPVQVPKNQLDTAFAGSEQFFTEQKKETQAQQDLTPENKATRKATVIIGGFTQAGNIARLKKWIKAQGYTVYEKKRNSLTVVGCIVAYETEKDFRRELAKIQRKYPDELEIRR